jgi:hypothetical protein
MGGEFVNFSDYISKNPTAKIINEESAGGTGGIRLGVGAPLSHVSYFGTNFKGNADAFTIGVWGKTTIYDFEYSKANAGEDKTVRSGSNHRTVTGTATGGGVNAAGQNTKPPRRTNTTDAPAVTDAKGSTGTVLEKVVVLPVTLNDIQAPKDGSPVKQDKRIEVSNIKQLYDAVNDKAKAGYLVVLAPGTYILDSSYPNRGRLELAHNMSLTGQFGNPKAVIIDVTNLPASSFAVPPSPTFPGNLQTGAVKMGNGYNCIEWMTLQNDPRHIIRSLIQTDLVATPLTKIRIAHTVVKGGNIGINIINRDAVSNGRTIDAEIEDNEISGNDVPPLGAGIQIQNSHNVSDATIRVILRRNYIQGNRIGIAAFNASSIQNRVEIKSYADRIEDNGVGLSLVGGFSELAEFPTKENVTLFEAYGTAVRNNLGRPQPISPILPGGVYAAGGTGFKKNKPGTVNNNKLEIHFHGCSIIDNVGDSAINAFGAYSAYPSSTPMGSNNIATIHLDGLSKDATVKTTASFPDEPAGTNTIKIIRN